MKRSLFLLLLFLTAAPLAGADPWTYARSEHFILAGSADEYSIRQVAADLEQFRDGFSRIFPVRSAPADMRVLVFRSDTEFQSYRPAAYGKINNVAAYYLHSHDLDYIALSAQPVNHRVVYHEYVHALMGDAALNLPPWFREGIAEFYSNFESEGQNRYQIGRAIPEHLRLLRSGKLIPVEQLLAATQGSLEAGGNGMFYAESWLLVHYLMLGERQKYQSQIPQLLVNWQLGMPVAESLIPLKLSPAGLDQALSAYLAPNGPPLPTQVVTAKGQPEAIKRTSTRMAPEAEAEFYRGDLLLGLNRPDEAESHLRHAIALNTMFGPAQAALGHLLTLRGSHSEALEYLKRAVELDPRDHLSHYYYASALWTSNISGSAAEHRRLAQAEAREAVNLSPQFISAIKLFARINIDRRENLNDTLTLLRKTRDLFPDAAELAYLEGFVLLQSGDTTGAREIAENLISRTTERSSLAKARQLLEAAEYEASGTRTPISSAVFGAREPRPASVPPPIPNEESRPVLQRERQTAATPAPARFGGFRYEIQASAPIAVAGTSFPPFPEALLKSDAGARLVLEVTSFADGSVIDVKVLESTDPSLNTATAAAVRRWSFGPGLATMKLTLIYEVHSISEAALPGR